MAALRHAFLALLAPFSALVDDGRARFAHVLFTMFAIVGPYFYRLLAGIAGGRFRTCLFLAVGHWLTLRATKRTLSAFHTVPAIFIDLAFGIRRRFLDAFVVCASAMWLGIEPLTNRARLSDCFLIVFRIGTVARFAFPLLATAVIHCIRFQCAVVAFRR